MTSRRGTLVEEGARELLQVRGYTVHVVPFGFNKRSPPAHLVATRPSGETRFIRIRKISHRSSTADTVAIDFANDIAGFRKYISRNPTITGLSCEIWIYSLTHGFRCFEVHMESIHEIPKLPLNNPVISTVKEAP